MKMTSYLYTINEVEGKHENIMKKRGKLKSFILK